MARSDDTQFYGKAPVMDHGTVTLGTAGTASVSTHLATLRCGFAQHQSGAIAASTLLVSALSSGVVTITDSAGAAHSGAVVSYLLIGTP